MDSLLRHIRACNNAALPGGRVRFAVAGEPVGWLDPALAERLLGLGCTRTARGVNARPEQLQPLARALADAGLVPWRSEPFDVRPELDDTERGNIALGQLDRGACPAFGVQEAGVHLNGLVEQGGATKLWVARRSASKLLDPGKLDHLVAGGIPSGLGPAETLRKEADEEAGIPPALVAGAVHVATIGYAMQRPEGLRRDWLYCYDLHLPPDFRPEARDGEVAGFELWDLPRVLETVRRSDDFKFNVNLVLIDLFLRRGLVGGEEAVQLRAALARQPSGGAAAIGMSRDSPPG